MNDFIAFPADKPSQIRMLEQALISIGDLNILGHQAEQLVNVIKGLRFVRDSIADNIKSEMKKNAEKLEVPKGDVLAEVK